MLASITKIKELNEKVLNEIKRLNKPTIKGDKVIFENSEEIFKIFSNCEEEDTLSPFNDYSYLWLHYFLNDFNDFLSVNTEKDLNLIFEEFEENISEYVEMNTEFYNTELLKWLSDNLNNGFYLEDAVKEGFINFENYDFYKHLRTSYNLALERHYLSYLENLKKYLIGKFFL